MGWFKGMSMLWKAITVAVAVIALIWALWFAYDLLTASDKVKGRLGSNQTDAALESGSDAVDTVGKRGDAETETDKKVKGITDDVEKTDNAADADAAGRDGLCQYFRLCD